MLGRRLRNERRNTCSYGCCTKTDAHRQRKTKNERQRDQRDWKKTAKETE